jgi:hypothetical protein
LYKPSVNKDGIFSIIYYSDFNTKYQIRVKSLLNNFLVNQKLKKFNKRKDYESMKKYLDNIFEKINFSIENKLYDEITLKKDFDLLVRTLEEFAHMVQ